MLREEMERVKIVASEIVKVEIKKAIDELRKEFNSQLAGLKDSQREKKTVAVENSGRSKGDK